MISDATYWKNDLLRAADWLELKLAQSRWYPATFASVEKTVMAGFYGVRKLVEAADIEARILETPIKLLRYPSAGKSATRLSRARHWELYDKGSPARCSLSLRELCNQFIHSYVFSCDFSGAKTLTVILVSSDRDRNRYLYSVSVPTIVSLFRTVGKSRPNQTALRFNAKTDDFDVSRRVGAPGERPRTLIRRSRKIAAGSRTG